MALSSESRVRSNPVDERSGQDGEPTPKAPNLDKILNLPGPLGPNTSPTLFQGLSLDDEEEVTPLGYSRPLEDTFMADPPPEAGDTAPEVDAAEKADSMSSFEPDPDDPLFYTRKWLGEGADDAITLWNDDEVYEEVLKRRPDFFERGVLSMEQSPEESYPIVEEYYKKRVQQRKRLVAHGTLFPEIRNLYAVMGRPDAYEVSDEKLAAEFANKAYEGQGTPDVADVIDDMVAIGQEFVAKLEDPDREGSENVALRRAESPKDLSLLANRMEGKAGESNQESEDGEPEEKPQEIVVFRDPDTGADLFFTDSRQIDRYQKELRWRSLEYKDKSVVEEFFDAAFVRAPMAGADLILEIGQYAQRKLAGAMADFEGFDVESANEVIDQVESFQETLSVIQEKSGARESDHIKQLDTWFDDETWAPADKFYSPNAWASTVGEVVGLSVPGIQAVKPARAAAKTLFAGSKWYGRAKRLEKLAKAGKKIGGRTISKGMIRRAKALQGAATAGLVASMYEIPLETGENLKRLYQEYDNPTPGQQLTTIGAGVLSGYVGSFGDMAMYDLLTSASRKAALDAGVDEDLVLRGMTYEVLRKAKKGTLEWLKRAPFEGVTEFAQEITKDVADQFAVRDEPMTWEEYWQANREKYEEVGIGTLGLTLFMGGIGGVSTAPSTIQQGITEHEQKLFSQVGTKEFQEYMEEKGLMARLYASRKKLQSGKEENQIQFDVSALEEDGFIDSVEEFLTQKNIDPNAVKFAVTDDGKKLDEITGLERVRSAENSLLRGSEFGSVTEAGDYVLSTKRVDDAVEEGSGEKPAPEYKKGRRNQYVTALGSVLEGQGAEAQAKALAEKEVYVGAVIDRVPEDGAVARREVVSDYLTGREGGKYELTNVETGETSTVRDISDDDVVLWRSRTQDLSAQTRRDLQRIEQINLARFGEQDQKDAESLIAWAENAGELDPEAASDLRESLSVYADVKETARTAKDDAVRKAAKTASRSTRQDLEDRFNALIERQIETQEQGAEQGAAEDNTENTDEDAGAAEDQETSPDEGTDEGVDTEADTGETEASEAQVPLSEVEVNVGEAVSSGDATALPSFLYEDGNLSVDADAVAVLEALQKGGRAAQLTDSDDPVIAVFNGEGVEVARGTSYEVQAQLELPVAPDVTRVREPKESTESQVKSRQSVWSALRDAVKDGVPTTLEEVQSALGDAVDNVRDVYVTTASQKPVVLEKGDMGYGRTGQPYFVAEKNGNEFIFPAPATESDFRSVEAMSFFGYNGNQGVTPALSWPVQPYDTVVDASGERAPRPWFEDATNSPGTQVEKEAEAAPENPQKPVGMGAAVGQIDNLSDARAVDLRNEYKRQLVAVDRLTNQVREAQEQAVEDAMNAVEEGGPEAVNEEEVFAEAEVLADALAKAKSNIETLRQEVVRRNLPEEFLDEGAAALKRKKRIDHQTRLLLAEEMVDDATVGVAPWAVQDTLDRLTETWEVSPEFVVVDSPADLPLEIKDAALKQGGPSAIPTIKGAFGKDGRIYIVSANLRNSREAALVILHEAAGHMGFQMLVKPSERGPLLRQVFNALEGKVLENGELRKAKDSEREQTLLRKLARRYANGDLSTDEAKELVAEEGLAHLAEFAPDASVMDRVYSGVRRFVRGVMKRLGLNTLPLSNAEVRYLLQDMRSVLSQPDLADGYDPTYTTFGPPRERLGQTPYYSRLMEGMLSPQDFVLRKMRVSDANPEGNPVAASVMKNLIKNVQGGVGFKTEEVDAIGLNDWLDEKADAGEDVTFADVQDYIREHQIQVIETKENADTLREEKRREQEKARQELKEAEAALEEAKEDYRSMVYDAADAIKSAYRDTPTEANKLAATLTEVALNGNLSNREGAAVDVARLAQDLKRSPDVPEAVMGAVDGLREQLGRIEALNRVRSRKTGDVDSRTPAIEREENPSVRFNQYVIPGGENQTNLLFQIPGPVQEKSNESRLEALEQELREREADLWVEYQTEIEAVRAEGRAMMDRVQEEGGDKWNDPRVEEPMARFRELRGGRNQRIREETADLRQEIEDLKEKNTLFVNPGHFDEPNVFAHARFNDRTVTLPNGRDLKVLFIEEIQSDWAQSDSRDDAPFQDSWYNLAVKRLFYYAAENGYDTVAWTTGDMQADRYSVSDYVEFVEYEFGSLYVKYSDGTDEKIFLRERGSGDPDFQQQLEDIVGETVAEKLRSEWNETEGPVLMDGSEAMNNQDRRRGMRTFYDEQVFGAAKKFVKKWGGRVSKAGDGFQITEGSDSGGRIMDRSIDYAHDLYGEENVAYQLAEFTEDGSFEPVSDVYDTLEEAEEARDRRGGPVKVYPRLKNESYDVHAATVSKKMRERLPEEGFPLFRLGEAQIHTDNFKDWFGNWEATPQSASKVVNEDGTPQVVYHGSPLEFNGGIEVFDPEMRGQNAGGADSRAGFFFTTSPPVAEAYTNPSEITTGLENPEYVEAQRQAEEARRRYQERVENGELQGAENVRERMAARREVRRIEKRAERILDSLPTETIQGSVYPVYLNIRNPMEVDFEGEVWDTDKQNFWIREAKAKGHDGVVFRNIMDDPTTNQVADTIVAFRPNQIKSATANQGTFDGSDPNIRLKLGGDDHGTIEQDAQNEGVRAQHVVDALKEMLTGMTVPGTDGFTRVKEFAMNRGYRNVVDENGRITFKSFEDLDAIFHMTGEFLYHEFRAGMSGQPAGQVRGVLRELDQVAENLDSVRKGMDTEKKRSLAMAKLFAEHFRGTDLSGPFPQVSKAFGEFADEYNLTENFHHAQDLYKAFETQSEMDKIDAMIVIKSQRSWFDKPVFRNPREWLQGQKEYWYTYLFDQFYPLYVQTRDMNGGRKPANIEDDIYVMARMMAGSDGAALDALENGVRTLDGRDLSEYSMLDAMKEVALTQEMLADFQRWGVLRRTVEINEQIEDGRRPEGFPVITDKDSALQKIDEILEKDERYKERFESSWEKMQNFNEALLEYAVDEGFLSRDAADRIQAMNAEYIPWNRLMEEDANGSYQRMGRRSAGSGGLITMDGADDLAVEDPLRHLMMNVFHLYGAIHRNRVFQAMYEQIPKGDDRNSVSASFIYEVGPPLQRVEASRDRVIEAMERKMREKGVPEEVQESTIENIKQVLSGKGADAVLPLFTSDTLDPDGNVVRAMVDGEPKYMYVDPIMLDAIDGWNPGAGPILNFVSGANSVFRKFATANNPVFTMVNFFRDVQTRLVQTDEEDLANQNKLPTADGLEAVADPVWIAANLVGDNWANVSSEKVMDLYRDFRSSGAYGATISMMDEQAQTTFLTTMRNQSIADGYFGSLRSLQSAMMDFKNGDVKEALSLAKQALRPIDRIKRMNDAFENSNRMREYKKAFNRKLSEKQQQHEERTGEPLESDADALRKARREAALTAGIKAREVTMDFSRAGRFTKVANRYVPFLNAAMQGFDRFANTLANQPKRAFQFLMVTQIIPGMLVAMANAGNKYYEEEDDYMKDLFMLFPDPFGRVDEDGVPMEFIRIPRAHLWGVFGAMVERASYHWAKTGQISPSEMLGGLLDKEMLKTYGAQLPINAGALIGTGWDEGKWGAAAGQILAGYLPQIHAFSTELASNYSMFREGSIIPAYENENIDPSLRYGLTTSKLSRFVSKKAEEAGIPFMDPRSLDYLVTGFTGGGGKAFVGLADEFLPEQSDSMSDIQERAKAERGERQSLTDTKLGVFVEPFEKALTVKDPFGSAKSVGQMFDHIAKIKRAKASHERMIERGYSQEELDEYMDEKGHLVGFASDSAFTSTTQQLKDMMDHERTIMNQPFDRVSATEKLRLQEKLWLGRVQLAREFNRIWERELEKLADE